jgi:hypothetical protein
LHCPFAFGQELIHSCMMQSFSFGLTYLTTVVIYQNRFFLVFENHGHESTNHPDNLQGSVAVSDNRPTMGHFLFELLLLGKEWPVLLQSLFSCKYLSCIHMAVGYGI